MIRYVTDGILLRESLGQGDLQRYGVIILDEEASQVLPFLPINPANRQSAQP
jgi:hypothetical protein